MTREKKIRLLPFVRLDVSCRGKGCGYRNCRSLHSKQMAKKQSVEQRLRCSSILLTCIELCNTSVVPKWKWSTRTFSLASLAPSRPWKKLNWALMRRRSHNGNWGSNGVRWCRLAMELLSYCYWLKLIRGCKGNLEKTLQAFLWIYKTPLVSDSLRIRWWCFKIPFVVD